MGIIVTYLPMLLSKFAMAYNIMIKHVVCNLLVIILGAYSTKKEPEKGKGRNKETNYHVN